VAAARARALAAAVLVAALLAAGCQRGGAEGPPPVRVGAATTTEQQVLAALAAEALRRNGQPAEVVPALGDSVDVRAAALDGRVDAYWDYSGAAWALALGLVAPPVDPQESFEAVAAEDADHGLLWLGPSRADARLAFFVRRGAAGAQEPTLSWLAGVLGAEGGELCADRGYLDSQAGLAHLAEVYSVAQEALATRAAREEVALRATAEGSCAAGLASSTSGTARTLDLEPLRDDQGVFPALAVAPVVRVDGRAGEPRAIAVLSSVADRLDTAALADLSAAATAGEPIDVLASRWLDDVGLVVPGG
jgi:osmoprotectant transport system substrate-binding protein